MRTQMVETEFWQEGARLGRGDPKSKERVTKGKTGRERQKEAARENGEAME